MCNCSIRKEESVVLSWVSLNHLVRIRSKELQLEAFEEDKQLQNVSDSSSYTLKKHMQTPFLFGFCLSNCFSSHRKGIKLLL